MSQRDLSPQSPLMDQHGGASAEHIVGGVTLLLAQIFVLSIFYLAWLLTEDYATAVFGGIFFSVIFHSTHREDLEKDAKECVENMQDIATEYAQISTFRYWVVGVPRSFFTFLVWGGNRGCFTFGLDKLPKLQDRKFFQQIIFYLGGFCVASLLWNPVITVVVGGVLWVFMFVSLFLPWSWARYQYWVKLVVEVLLTVFLLVGVTVNIGGEVKEAATYVSTGGQSGLEIAIQALQANVPNATKNITIAIYEDFQAVAGNFSVTNASAWTSLSDKLGAVWNRAVTGAGDSVVPGVDASAALNITELGESLRVHAATAANSMFLFLGSSVMALMGVVVNVVSFIYQLSLFITIYLVCKQRDHSMLYHVVKKIVNISHPHWNNHQTDTFAKARESEIVSPIRQLMMSFLHKAVFYFTTTLLLFRYFGLSYAVTAALINTAFALFPLVSGYVCFFIPLVSMIYQGHWGSVACLVVVLYLLSNLDGRLVTTQREAICAPATPGTKKQKRKNKKHHKDATPAAATPDNAPRRSGSNPPAARRSGLDTSQDDDCLMRRSCSESVADFKTPGAESGHLNNKGQVSFPAQPRDQPSEPHHQPVDPFYDVLVKTSIIHGYFSFGALGVLVGPCVVIVLRLVWKWLGGEEYSNWSQMQQALLRGTQSLLHVSNNSSPQRENLLDHHHAHQHHLPGGPPEPFSGAQRPAGGTASGSSFLHSGGTTTQSSLGQPWSQRASDPAFASKVKLE